MKSKRFFYPFLFLFIFFCAKGTMNFWGNESEGFTLVYYPNDSPDFIYSYSSDIEMSMDMMGNPMVTTTKEEIEMGFKVKSSDLVNGSEIECEIIKRIEDVDSPMGDAPTDFSKIFGKKVEFTLIPNGEQTAYKGFDMLPVVTNEGTEYKEKHYQSMVNGVFPKMPGKKVKIGDTWTFTETDFQPMPAGELKMVSEYTYKLTGLTVKDGIECMKIDAEYKQNQSGTMESQGFALTISGEGSGKDVIYFAYKKGIFLSREGTMEAKGSIDASGMAIPFNMKFVFKSNIK